MLQKHITDFCSGSQCKNALCSCNPTIFRNTALDKPLFIWSNSPKILLPLFSKSFPPGRLRLRTDFQLSSSWAIFKNPWCYTLIHKLPLLASVGLPSWTDQRSEQRHILCSPCLALPFQVWDLLEAHSAVSLGVTSLGIVGQFLCVRSFIPNKEKKCYQGHFPDKISLTFLM